MQWIQANWLKVVAALMLAGALFPIPYFAYYQLTNWVVLGAAIMTAWQARALGKEWIMWLFVLVAVVFNPIAPLYLRPDIWHVLDIVAALIFLLSFFFLRTKN
jgi:hypothetical protein